MSVEIAQLVLFEVFAWSVFWTCLCRATHMSKRTTVRAIRWAFVALGVASVLAGAAPLFGYDPDGVVTMLAGAVAIVQAATAYHWRHGVPVPFRIDGADKCLACASKPIKEQKS
jgi:predicted membrane channel-forming protein YqfA (hemolysin III family)